jgi:hypothetical protein
VSLHELAAPPPPTAPPPAAADTWQYRDAHSGAVEGPYQLNVFAAWAAAGLLAPADVASLRVWRTGAAETDAVGLRALLRAAATRQRRT